MINIKDIQYQNIVKLLVLSMFVSIIVACVSSRSSGDGGGGSTPNVVFESDFSQDSGYKQSGGERNKDNVPTGWDEVTATGDSVIEVINNLGKGKAKPALKLSWDPNLGQPTVSLRKHLTGDEKTGYSELYLRYHVKLPKNFKAGDGIKNSLGISRLPYWKWGRLWQNTSVNGGSENRANSSFIVWNFTGSDKYGIRVGATFAANNGVNLDKGSAGGERYNFKFFDDTDNTKKSGHLQNMGDGDWELDWTTNPGFFKTRLSGIQQKWHTIEFHVKLASSPTAEDGLWEVWFDGVQQFGGEYKTNTSSGAIPLKNQGMPTAKNGSGMNYFTFFDNMARWNKDWGKSGVDGYILVNDVVVSTTRIGHSYVVPGN